MPPSNDDGSGAWWSPPPIIQGAMPGWKSDGANPISRLSRTLREAQTSCDTLVGSARNHLVSELDRMESSITKGAQESIVSLRGLGSNAPFWPAVFPGATGIRRIGSDNSLLRFPSAETSSVPVKNFNLMQTLERTMNNAKLAAENARSLAMTVAFPAQMHGDYFASSSSGAISTPEISLERMMSRPLSVLQKAQKAVETTYNETHMQVYQLFADTIMAPSQENARFVCASPGFGPEPATPAGELDMEAQCVFNALRLGKSTAPALSASVASHFDSSLQQQELGEEDFLQKDDGFLADWKKWLVAWELRAAQFTAAEIVGQIDLLPEPCLDDGSGKRGSLDSNMKDSWERFGGVLRSRALWPQLGSKQGSDLRAEGRHIAIFTTASLPWMTGTAVNPLLRAVFLSKDSNREVTLVIPWLSKADQKTVYPNITFDSPEEQEAYVREWARNRTGIDANFKITFYPGRYAAEKGSILPVGDLTKYVPDEQADVAVLEEPEHLNWYHHGRCWSDKFSHVVGIVHTNYLDYARREEGGDLKEKLLRSINSWVCQAHCHKVVKLSGAVQPLPKETTEFVHGVSPAFLEVGVNKRSSGSDKPRFADGFYFIGKVVWAKGYTELLQMLQSYKEKTGDNLSMDVFGGGPDLPEVTASSSQQGLNLKFHGPKDHLSRDIHEYKAFINPSTSDVVATTSAEALAMGKFVICCEHPSNKFFSRFSNCLIYRTPEEFAEKVKYAMEHEPAPLSEEERYSLTWEAATERFLDVGSLSATERSPGILGKAKDSLAYYTHNTLTGIEPIRLGVGAGPQTRDDPVSVADYEPVAYDGCWLDRRAKQ